MIVVNIRNVVMGEGDVYIGRRNSYYGLEESIWANPFRISRKCGREESIEKYRKLFSFRMENSEAWREKLKRLASAKRLVCWCKPLACHGDVLLELIHQYF